MDWRRRSLKAVVLAGLTLGVFCSCTGPDKGRSATESAPSKATAGPALESVREEPSRSNEQRGLLDDSGAPIGPPAAVVAQRPAYTMDAMVGQINGEPVYAAAALEPVAEQLEALGRSRPLSEFRQRAGELIAGRLRQVVIDALILSEAEGDLSEGERSGLEHMMQKKREELVLKWGGGSVAVTEDRLMQETARTLKQTLEDTRQRLLVQRYLQTKLIPQINVTRKDIERYYRSHYDDYNAPASRVLRLIRVTAGADAETIGQMLANSEPFDRVASELINQYRPGNGGLMSEPAVGEEVFGVPALNAAMRGVRPGEYSQQVEAGGFVWWVYLESIDQPVSRSLRDVQLEIESILRRQQFQELSRRYRRDLYLSGSYNPIEEMSEALLSVAVSRYAKMP